MNKKRTIGTTIYAVLYLICAALTLPNALMHLWVAIYSLLHIGAPASGHDPSGFEIFLLSLAGTPFSVLPPAIFGIVGIGLLKLSNKIRILMLIFSLPVGIFLTIFISDIYRRPWKFSSQYIF